MCVMCYSYCCFVCFSFHPLYDIKGTFSFGDLIKWKYNFFSLDVHKKIKNCLFLSNFVIFFSKIFERRIHPHLKSTHMYLLMAITHVWLIFFYRFFLPVLYYMILWFYTLTCLLCNLCVEHVSAYRNKCPNSCNRF